MRNLVYVVGVLALLGCTISDYPPVDYANTSGGQNGQIEDQRPNILMILVDDLGYTDFGAYGGDVKTPNVDALAHAGLRFSNAHAYPSCGPTRATLITGKDPHRVGFGSQNGFGPPGVPLTTPGYSGSLEGSYISIAQVLAEVGYETFQVGKWHLGHETHTSPGALGFMQNYSLLDGAASHYSDMKPIALSVSKTGKAAYEHNGAPLEKLPDDFYSTRDYTDRLLDMLRTHNNDDKPFFAYLAYTAVHDPLHAPEDLILKYLEEYEEGYEALRDERIRRAVKSGLINDQSAMTRWLLNTPRWEELTGKQKRDLQQRLAVYAAMIEYLDTQIGRVVHYLKQSGEFDNTLIVVMSDNGAAATPRTVYALGKEGLAWQQQAYPKNDIADYGKPGSFPTLSRYNAQAVSGPLFSSKGNVYEGGTRVPLIIKAPLGEMNRVSHTFFHVADLYATFADYAGADISAQQNLLGDSGRGLIEGRSQQVGDDEFGSEFLGLRAFRSGPWKLVFVPTEFGGTGRYALYNLTQDPGESNDLAAAFPDRVDELSKKWNQYAHENGVVPASMEAVNRLAEKTAAVRLSIDWGS